MAQSSTTTTLFKSRKNLLSLLKEQGYDINDYMDFSINDVHIMSNNKQLDMLLSNPKDSDENKKVYVKYHLGKTLRRENINDYIDDLYTIENVLGKNDTLIIIMKQEPHEPLTTILNEIWEQEGIFIILFNLERLQFNILEHEYVPKHTIISMQDMKAFKQRFNIKNDSEIPEISRYDPVSLAIGLRPGQICKIIRPSKTAITSEYYRICSQ
jgi:DNA-directed RNA polymerase subunit H (RpoH/RPB5)